MPSLKTELSTILRITFVICLTLHVNSTCVAQAPNPGSIPKPNPVPTPTPIPTSSPTSNPGPKPLPDGRTVLANTASIPANFVGLLYFDDPRPAADRPSKMGKGRVRIGTGFLVSDKHIVTCAHCVTHNPNELKGDKPYPDGGSPQSAGMGYPTDIFFAPGHHGRLETPTATDGTPTPASQPFGRYRVTAITQIFSSYFKEKEPNEISKYDLVVLKLDRSTGVGGHFSVAPFDWRQSRLFSRPVLRLNGYDTDLSKIRRLSGGHERRDLWQITRGGKVALAMDLKKVIRVKHLQGELTCKAYPGASGGPIWLNDSSGHPTVVGIAVKTDRQKSVVGLFFTGDHVAFIKAGL